MGCAIASTGLVIAGFGALAAQLTAGLSLLDRLRREEARGHAELVLATATSRTALLRAYAVPALLVPLALCVLSAALLAVPQAIRDGDARVIGRLAGAGLAQAPGVLLIVALAIAVHGLAPRLGLLPWAVAAWSVLITWIGAVLGFPDWLLHATPFAHLPRIPAEAMSWPPVLVESGLAVILIGAGLWGCARRNIT